MKILKYILNRNKKELNNTTLYIIDKTIYDIYINSSATFEEMLKYQDVLLNYSKGCSRITHIYYANDTRWIYYLKNKINIFNLNFEDSYIWARNNNNMSNIEFNEEYIKIIKSYQSIKKDKTYIEIVKDNKCIDSFYITLTLDELFNILYN